MPFKQAREIADGEDEEDEVNLAQLADIEKKVNGEDIEEIWSKLVTSCVFVVNCSNLAWCARQARSWNQWTS